MAGRCEHFQEMGHAVFSVQFWGWSSSAARIAGRSCWKPRKGGPGWCRAWRFTGQVAPVNSGWQVPIPWRFGIRTFSKLTWKLQFPSNFNRKTQRFLWWIFHKQPGLPESLIYVRCFSQHVEQHAQENNLKELQIRSGWNSWPSTNDKWCSMLQPQMLTINSWIKYSYQALAICHSYHCLDHKTIELWQPFQWWLSQSCSMVHCQLQLAILTIEHLWTD